MDKRFTFRTFIEELVLIVLTLISLIPLYYIVISAFKKRTDIVHHPLEINADMLNVAKNFSYAFKKMDFMKALGNTAFITGVSIIGIIIFASLAGFAIARIRWSVFQKYYTFLMAMMVIPFIGCLLPLVKLATSLKLYGSVVGCMVIQMAWNLPFATFLYAGFMRGIPKELEEAAYLDGCSTFGVYSRIFLPLLAPVTATNIVRIGVSTWNDYLVSSVLLNPSSQPTLMVGIKKFFGKYTTEYGYAFAGIFMSSLPMIIMFIFLQKYYVSGITVGSVKG